MEDRYTLELTLDELKTVVRALTYEVDRLDELELLDRIKSSKLEEAEVLENMVRNIYTNALLESEHERSWINAERDRV